MHVHVSWRLSVLLMDLQSCVVLVCSAVGVLLAALLLGWCHWVSAFYCRGCLHYRRHRRRRAEKKVVREQEEVRKETFST